MHWCGDEAMQRGAPVKNPWAFKVLSNRNEHDGCRLLVDFSLISYWTDFCAALQEFHVCVPE